MARLTAHVKTAAYRQELVELVLSVEAALGRLDQNRRDARAALVAVAEVVGVGADADTEQLMARLKELVALSQSPVIPSDAYVPPGVTRVVAYEVSDGRRFGDLEDARHAELLIQADQLFKGTGIVPRVVVRAIPPLLEACRKCGVHDLDALSAYVARENEG